LSRVSQLCAMQIEASTKGQGSESLNALWNNPLSVDFLIFYLFTSHFFSKIMYLFVIVYRKSICHNKGAQHTGANQNNYGMNT